MFFSKIAFITSTLNLNRSMAFYAVAKGHKVGIYDSWGACEQQVKGFKNARYKKFKSRTDAEDFIKQFGDANAMKILGKSKESDANITKISTQQQDYWPESDGDSFEENLITDNELLNAVYEVEGLPESATTSNRLKRKADTTDASQNKAKLPRHSSKVLQVAGYKNIGNYEFPIDDQGYVIVYTDGSCINNGKKNACAGFGVYFGHDHPLNAAKPVVGRVTNNVGEIQAATHAIQVARDIGIRQICICTDSQFLINSATLWIPAWKRKNWCLRNGEPVKNVVDFKVLDLLLEDDKVFVKWNYVKGHASIDGNEMADLLARDGAAEYARLHNK